MSDLLDTFVIPTTRRLVKAWNDCKLDASNVMGSHFTVLTMACLDDLVANVPQTVGDVMRMIGRYTESDGDQTRQARINLFDVYETWCLIGRPEHPFAATDLPPGLFRTGETVMTALNPKDLPEGWQPDPDLTPLNVAAIRGNGGMYEVVQVDPFPSEPKFKVGDQVEIVNPDPSLIAPEGIWTVESCSSEGRYSLRQGNGIQRRYIKSLPEESLKLVEKAKETPMATDGPYQYETTNPTYAQLDEHLSAGGKVQVMKGGEWVDATPDDIDEMRGAFDHLDSAQEQQGVGDRVRLVPGDPGDTRLSRGTTDLLLDVLRSNLGDPTEDDDLVELIRKAITRERQASAIQQGHLQSQADQLTNQLAAERSVRAVERRELLQARPWGDQTLDHLWIALNVVTSLGVHLEKGDAHPKVARAAERITRQLVRAIDEVQALASSELDIETMSDEESAERAAARRLYAAHDGDSLLGHEASGTFGEDIVMPLSPDGTVSTPPPVVDGAEAKRLGVKAQERIIAFLEDDHGPDGLLTALQRSLQGLMMGDDPTPPLSELQDLAVRKHLNRLTHGHPFLLAPGQPVPSDMEVFVQGEWRDGDWVGEAGLSTVATMRRKPEVEQLDDDPRPEPPQSEAPPVERWTMPVVDIRQIAFALRAIPGVRLWVNSVDDEGEEAPEELYDHEVWIGSSVDASMYRLEIPYCFTRDGSILAPREFVSSIEKVLLTGMGIKGLISDRVGSVLERLLTDIYIHVDRLNSIPAEITDEVVEDPGYRLAISLVGSRMDRGFSYAAAILRSLPQQGSDGVSEFYAATADLLDAIDRCFLQIDSLDG